MSYMVTVYLTSGITMGSSFSDRGDVEDLVNTLALAWRDREARMIEIGGEPRMLINPAMVAAVTIAQEEVADAATVERGESGHGQDQGVSHRT